MSNGGNGWRFALRRLDHHQDELGLAMRATGRRVASAGMQAQIRELTARIEAPEHRDG